LYYSTTGEITEQFDKESLIAAGYEDFLDELANPVNSINDFRRTQITTDIEDYKQRQGSNPEQTAECIVDYTNDRTRWNKRFTHPCE
jgi:hypothetical protein